MISHWPLLSPQEDDATERRRTLMTSAEWRISTIVHFSAKPSPAFSLFAVNLASTLRPPSSGDGNPARLITRVALQFDQFSPITRVHQTTGETISLPSHQSFSDFREFTNHRVASMATFHHRDRAHLSSEFLTGTESDRFFRI
jgi:hypothetical protein